MKSSINHLINSDKQSTTQILSNHESALPDSHQVENLENARKAIESTRIIIPFDGAASQPEMKDVEKVQNLWEKILELRLKKPTFEESLYYFLLTNTNISVIDLKKINKKSKKQRIGNCGELSHLVINFLKKNTLLKKNNDHCHRVEIISNDDGNHEFVVIDRDLNSDINKPLMWGKRAVIVDALTGKAFEAANIYNELLHYNYDPEDEDGPNIFSQFTEDDKLSVSMEISFFYDDGYNLDIIGRFKSKLVIINSLMTEYSNDIEQEKIKPLMELINTYLAETIEVSDFTNLDIERNLDRKMRKLLKLMQEAVETRFFYDMIINMHAIFPSIDNYFHRLIHLDIYIHLLLHIESNTSPSINFLKEQLKDINLLNKLLKLAIDYKQSETIVSLLKYGADPMIDCGEQDPLLHLAILHNDQKIIEQIITQMSQQDSLRSKLINFQNQRGQTPLHILQIVKTDSILIQKLLDLGANPEIKNISNETPLDLARKWKRKDNIDHIFKYYPHLIDNPHASTDPSNIVTSTNSLNENDQEPLNNRLKRKNENEKFEQRKKLGTHYFFNPEKVISPTHLYYCQNQVDNNKPDNEIIGTSLTNW